MLRARHLKGRLRLQMYLYVPDRRQGQPIDPAGAVRLPGSVPYLYARTDFGVTGRPIRVHRHLPRQRQGDRLVLQRRQQPAVDPRVSPQLNPPRRVRTSGKEAT
jgi:hypothetical protein